MHIGPRRGLRLDLTYHIKGAVQKGVGHFSLKIRPATCLTVLSSCPPCCAQLAKLQF